MFSIRGLRLSFPAGALGCAVCFALPLFLPVYLRECGAAGFASCCTARPAPQSATLLGPPVAALPRVLAAMPRMPTSTPPTGVAECFFFISLIVGLPYSSILCQFWLFFVLKLLSFFWLCKETQCVYLCLHLGRKFSSLQSFC